MDLELAPGRYPIPRSNRWTLVVLVPVFGVVVLGLFLDGEIVELIDDPLDVLGYLRTSACLPALAHDAGVELPASWSLSQLTRWPPGSSPRVAQREAVSAC